MLSKNKSKIESEKKFLINQRELNLVIKKSLLEYLKKIDVYPFNEKNFDILLSIGDKKAKEAFFYYLLIFNRFHKDIEDFNKMSLFAIDKKKRDINFKEDYKNLKRIRDVLVDTIFYTSKDLFNILLNNVCLTSNLYKKLIVLYSNLYVLYTYIENNIYKDISFKEMNKTYETLIKDASCERKKEYINDYKLLIQDLISKYYSDNKDMEYKEYYDIKINILELDLIFKPPYNKSSNLDEENTLLKNILGLNYNFYLIIDNLNKNSFTLLEEIRESKNLIVSLQKYKLIGSNNEQN